jgi:hypothetical protein
MRSRLRPKAQASQTPRFKLRHYPAGSWTLVQRKASNSKMGFSPGVSSTPALKRRLEVELFPGALKRSFPRINAGAPTRKNAPRVLHARGRTRLDRHQRQLHPEFSEEDNQ